MKREPELSVVAHVAGGLYLNDRTFTRNPGGRIKRSSSNRGRVTTASTPSPLSRWSPNRAERQASRVLRCRPEPFDRSKMQALESKARFRNRVADEALSEAHRCRRLCTARVNGKLLERVPFDAVNHLAGLLDELHRLVPFLLGLAPGLFCLLRCRILHAPFLILGVGGRDELDHLFGPRSYARLDGALCLPSGRASPLNLIRILRAGVKSASKAARALPAFGTLSICEISPVTSVPVGMTSLSKA